MTDEGGSRIGGGSDLPLTDDVILGAARDALHHEASAVRALADRLDERFLRALEHIRSSDGRVVVTGLGKSGLIGRKIAASLSSTGSPAFFVHAAEALHGDSGMILPQDVMIAISNSGETSEVVTFAGMAHARGSVVIAFTGAPVSSLASMADEVLDIGIEREADPHDLAPTASTTVTMALGDALCVALMMVRGFSAEDFLANHPGGSLGHRASPTEDDPPVSGPV
jgi:arabinose-5-phosphate isomerase